MTCKRCENDDTKSHVTLAAVTYRNLARRVHHQSEACPMADVAVPMRVLYACRFCDR